MLFLQNLKRNSFVLACFKKSDSRSRKEETGLEKGANS
jgi:hypothetical protein